MNQPVIDRYWDVASNEFHILLRVPRQWIMENPPPKSYWKIGVFLFRMWLNIREGR